MAYKTTISQSLPERKTARFTAVMKDETNTVVPGSSLNTLTLTLYNKKDLTVINSRNKHDILNTNGGTVSSLGNLTLILDPADMIIVHIVNKQEVHVALIEWTYGAGRAGGHEIEFTVDNLSLVP